MKVIYSPQLMEEAAFRHLSHLERSGYRSEYDEYHSLADPIYELPEDDREIAFEKVNKIFTSLSDDMTPPIIIIATLYREIKALIAMSTEIQQNTKIEEVLTKHRVWQKRKPLLKNALKKHSYQGLQKILLTLGRIDRSLKGMDNLNVYDELKSILIALSGKRNGLNS